MMRFFLVILAALAFVGGAAGTASAQEARWRHYGADPAYASKDAAKADAANVFRRAGWPPEAIAAMTERMRTVPPERIELRNGDRLDFMRSGRTGLWRNVLVDFVPPPGRGVSVVVAADRWVVVVGGVTYEAIIPDVCNNLAGRRSATPPRQDPCVYVVLPAQNKDSHVNVGLYGFTPEELATCPPSWQSGGTGTSGRVFDPNGYQPLRDCERRPCDWTAVTRSIGLPLVQSGSFQVADGWYAIRVPRVAIERQDRRVVLCLTDDQGRSTNSIGVQQHEYRQVSAGNYVATVWYDQANVPQEFLRTNTILWWRWPHLARQQYASR